MRITKIEIKNFRAFPGICHIDLHKSGKNLLVYGENGSGKSSLYQALELFLESGEKNHQFKRHQNIFSQSDGGHIKLHLRDNAATNEHIYEWSKTVMDETVDPLIIEASKTKGFLDYKSLLETHYIHREEENVNVFKLLVENLLVNIISRLTNQPLGEEWERMKQVPRPYRNAKARIAELEAQLEAFNNGLAGRLGELETKTSEILGKFGYDVALRFDFENITYNQDEKTLDNQQILLKVEFFDTEVPAHHLLLNEAKLSAIAIAIYLASILIQPGSDLKVLALDDVLIGLDMSNRLPVLDILNAYFSDYQIFLTTYDRAWYEILKQRTDEKNWKYAEFYFGETDEYEIPVYVEDKAYLEKAREFLDANDYKACAVYLRTAFEEMIKRFCEKKNLAVQYCENPKDLKSQYLWDPIKAVMDKSTNFPLLDLRVVDKIDKSPKFILNALCHATFVNIHKKELEEVLEAVEHLKLELNRHLKSGE